MDKVLVFSENIIIEDSSSFEVRNVYSMEELARKLVSEDNIRCLIVGVPELHDDTIRFFNSVKTNFPLLEAAVITPEKNKIIRGYKYIDSSEADYMSETEKFILNSENKNKRNSNRFSWPLTAWFSEDDKEWSELEIFSISSSGAYLKTNSLFPKGGLNAKVKINFANFTLESSCEVIDSQSRSSNYPFGFSIRFTSITEEGTVILNKLVNDAVIKILMEPEADPVIPSLGGDQLTPDFTFF